MHAIAVFASNCHLSIYAMEHDHGVLYNDAVIFIVFMILNEYYLPNSNRNFKPSVTIPTPSLTHRPLYYQLFVAGAIMLSFDQNTDFNTSSSRFAFPNIDSTMNFS